MKFNARQYSLASFSVLIALSGTAHSATTYMEARNDAMGGTGVASSHYGTAALANPALLTHFGASDDFSLILPSVGAQVSGYFPHWRSDTRVLLQQRRHAIVPLFPQHTGYAGMAYRRA